MRIELTLVDQRWDLLGPSRSLRLSCRGHGKIVFRPHCPWLLRRVGGAPHAQVRRRLCVSSGKVGWPSAML